MSENPWCNLPAMSPYFLPEDTSDLRVANARWGPQHNFYLHDDVLPEPFVGAMDAPVVLLSNNPGYTEESLPLRNDPMFKARMRKNLLHEQLDFPLLFLAPEFTDRGRKWWKQKTKALISVFGQEIVARSILNVTYFPYVSRRFGHRHLPLPSQDYSFRLVRDAVNRKAVIVLMRPGQEGAWKKAVPELNQYERFFRVSNPQNPAISPGNLGSDFQKVVEAIRHAKMSWN